MFRKTILLLSITLLAAGISGRADNVAMDSLSVNDLMVTVITPATDTLWGIEDPQSDAEWQVFLEAADVVIAAGNQLKAGGTGPDDNEWAATAEWQAFADRLVAAGVQAKTAAAGKDLDGMFTAGEVLYPPCEECHLQFHPGL
jgi:cytochrome c556